MLLFSLYDAGALYTSCVCIVPRLFPSETLRTSIYTHKCTPPKPSKTRVVQCWHQLNYNLAFISKTRPAQTTQSLIFTKASKTHPCLCMHFIVSILKLVWCPCTLTVKILDGATPLDGEVTILNHWWDTKSTHLPSIFSRSCLTLHTHGENVHKHHAVVLRFF